jgi:hypothetical protein
MHFWRKIVYQLEPLLTLEDMKGQRDALFTHGTIFVPPKVTIGWMPEDMLLGFRHVCPVNAQRETTVLFYPRPKGWDVIMPSTVVPMRGIVESDWELRHDSGSSVLTDFLQLAEISDEEILTASSSNDIAAFAKKWGPLWICRTAVHTTRMECYWQPETWVLDASDATSLPSDFFRDQKKDPCRWLPMEEVGVFVHKAREVRALFEALTLLQRNEPVPASLWRLVLRPGLIPWSTSDIMDAAKAPLDEQRQGLFFVLRGQITHSSEPRVMLGWDNGPKLHIVPRTPGFIHVVMTTLVQLLCQAKGGVQCDECGRFYMRSGRRPRTSGRNFCPDCGARASKRQWAQRKRDTAHHLQGNA